MILLSTKRALFVCGQKDKRWMLHYRATARTVSDTPALQIGRGNIAIVAQNNQRKKQLVDRCRRRRTVCADGGALRIEHDEVRLFAFLTDEIWPQIPPELLGTHLSKQEEEKILGYGEIGV